MHFIYKYLFKSFNYIVYLRVLSDDRLLSNIVADKIVEKSLIDIFVIIVHANAINLIFKRVEIILKAQKYRKDLALKTYIINLRIPDAIIFKRYKIFIVVETGGRNRSYEVEINKFVGL